MVKKNYNYGKLVDGKLEYAPNRIKGTVINNKGKEVAVQIINASADKYLAQGWYPIVHTTQPEFTEDDYYRQIWTQQGNEILEGWEYVPYIEQE